MRWGRISPDLINLCPAKSSSEHLSLNGRTLAASFLLWFPGPPLVYSAFVESLASCPPSQKMTGSPGHLPVVLRNLIAWQLVFFFSEKQANKLNKVAFFVRIFILDFRADPKLQSAEIRVKMESNLVEQTWEEIGK